MSITTIFEIVYTILSIAAVLLLRNKNKWGWLSWNASNIFIVANFIMGDKVISAGMFSLYNVINFSSFFKWYQEDLKQQPNRWLTLGVPLLLGILLSSVGIVLGVLLK